VEAALVGAVHPTTNGEAPIRQRFGGIFEVLCNLIYQITT
jgi:hypothetical protein